MRVVGYVRETPGPDTAETAFMQSERIRRWSERNSYQLIGVCQDARRADEAAEREGYAALLGIIASGQADIVALASLDALSPDKVAQEVMLWELRRTGTAIASTSEEDLGALSQPPTDPARLFIRDVLGKADRYQVAFGSETDDVVTLPEPEDAIVDEFVPDVVIEFVESLPTTDPSRASA